MFFIQAFTVIGLFLILLGYAFRKIHRVFEKGHDRLMKFLLWNWIIRLVLESALEIAFASTLNIKFGNFSDPWGSEINLYMAFLFGGCVLLLPIFICLFYVRNFDKMKDRQFEERFGAPFEGL